MAFDGVLTPESASFAGQAGLSHSLAYQNTPERRLHRFPSQGPQVPPPVGKPEWSAPKVNRSTAGLWGVVAIRSRPTVPPPAPLSHGAPPRRARRGQRRRRRTAKCRGASLPNVIHWGWRGAPAPSNPDRGELSPGPPSPPPLPSPSPMTEASMPREATSTGGMRRFGEAFDHNGEGPAL